MGVFKTVGVVIFTEVERLDFEGLLGVLGWEAKLSDQTASVVRISKNSNTVTDHLAGTKIEADASLDAYDQLVMI